MSQLLVTLVSREVQLIKAENQRDKTESVKFAVISGGNAALGFSVVTRCEQMAGGQWSDRHGGSGTFECHSCPPEQQSPAGEPWMCQ